MEEVLAELRQIGTEKQTMTEKPIDPKEGTIKKVLISALFALAVIGGSCADETHEGVPDGGGITPFGQALHDAAWPLIEESLGEGDGKTTPKDLVFVRPSVLDDTDSNVLAAMQELSESLRTDGDGWINGFIDMELPPSLDPHRTVVVRFGQSVDEDGERVISLRIRGWISREDLLKIQEVMPSERYDGSWDRGYGFSVLEEEGRIRLVEKYRWTS